MKLKYFNRIFVFALIWRKICDLVSKIPYSFYIVDYKIMTFSSIKFAKRLQMAGFDLLTSKFVSQRQGMSHYLIVYYIDRIWYFWYQKANFTSNQCKNKNSVKIRQFHEIFYQITIISIKLAQKMNSTLVSRNFSLVTGWYCTILTQPDG